MMKLSHDAGYMFPGHPRRLRGILIIRMKEGMRGSTLGSTGDVIYSAAGEDMPSTAL